MPLLIGCEPCDRSAPDWIPGLILVSFKDGVTPADAAVIVTRLGYSFSPDPTSPHFGHANVPHGEECWAEARLGAQPGVSSAWQEMNLIEH